MPVNHLRSCRTRFALAGVYSQTRVTGLQGVQAGAGAASAMAALAGLRARSMPVEDISPATLPIHHGAVAKTRLSKSSFGWPAMGCGPTLSPSSIVAALFTLAAGQFGRPSPLGFPVLMKFTQ